PERRHDFGQDRTPLNGEDRDARRRDRREEKEVRCLARRRAEEGHQLDRHLETTSSGRGRRSGQYTACERNCPHRHVLVGRRGPEQILLPPRAPGPPTAPLLLPTAPHRR